MGFDTFFSAFAFFLGLFFQNAIIETFVGWKSYFGFFVTDYENISTSGGESFTIGVSQVYDIETAQMSFNMKDGSNSSDVVTASDVS